MKELILIFGGYDNLRKLKDMNLSSVYLPNSNIRIKLNREEIDAALKEYRINNRIYDEGDIVYHRRSVFKNPMQVLRAEDDYVFTTGYWGFEIKYHVDDIEHLHTKSEPQLTNKVA